MDSMTPLYPLRFEPILRRYLWGGRRLGTELGKPIGEGSDYAESWELVDHGADQSVVKFGPLQGTTLSDLFARQGAELFGEKAYATWKSIPRPPGLEHRFPLLFKFLDCQKDLSIQIHPNDEQAQRKSPPDLGKTEAWIVMHSNPGSRVFVGLKPGVGREELQEAVDSGHTTDVLHSFEPKAGDCIFVPAGTVHALGQGFLVAEIQQSSDTTYRLYDWDRVDSSGKGRPLHIADSLAVLAEPQGPVNAVEPQPLEAGRERLVDCSKFILDRVTFDQSYSLSGDDSFHLLAVLEGSVTIKGDPSGLPLKRGETMLIPAACGKVQATPLGSSATLLDIHWPRGDELAAKFS